MQMYTFAYSIVSMLSCFVYDKNIITIIQLSVSISLFFTLKQIKSIYSEQSYKSFLLTKIYYKMFLDVLTSSFIGTLGGANSS